MRVLGLIPARSGSKGIPGKNLADLGGRPLIDWTIAAASACAGIDRVVLSSDDAAIIGAARAVGCEAPFVRPAALATDTATSVDVALHALDALDGGFDTLVLLQPTSPFRTAEDIEACLRLRRAGAWGAVSVTEMDRSPWHAFTLEADGHLTPLMGEIRSQRRQDLPAAVALNGAVYAVDVGEFRRRRTFIDSETAGYLMPRARSLDIDDPLDLAIARALLTFDKDEP